MCVPANGLSQDLRAALLGEIWFDLAGAPTDARFPQNHLSDEPEIQGVSEKAPVGRSEPPTP